MSLLQRKESLRDAYIRSVKEKGTKMLPTFQRHGERGAWTWKRKKPLKKVSKSKRRKLNEYLRVRNEWMKDHHVCMICLCRNLTPAPATEVHHVRGRAGKLLLDTRFWASSCRGCREWPHENPKEARAAGVLAEPWEWNVCPP